MSLRKSIGNETDIGWRTNGIFISLLLMTLSLFVSRAGLSISIMLFLALTVLHKNFFTQLKQFVFTPYLLVFSLLFFIPFVSGAWSENTENWLDVVRLKLPLLFFPIAFAGNWRLTAVQWRWVGYVFLAGVFIGSCWSLLNYFGNTEAMHEAYLRAKTLQTPLENDHVRFSWLVSIAVVLICFLIQQAQGFVIKFVWALSALFLAVYLHVLSARTGLFSLYIFLLVFAIWLIGRKKNPRLSGLIVLLVVALPMAAWFFFPTFQNRIRYFRYDLSYVQKAEYLPGSSDGARTMSLKAGWHLLQNNPLGVGAGDVLKEADKWYQQNVPTVLPSDKFQPSSEWLIYGGFAGWPGVILFTLVMLWPLLINCGRERIFWISFHLTAAFSFAFDMGLEVQYGIFSYAFISLWWWKYFCKKDAAILTTTATA